MAFVVAWNGGSDDAYLLIDNVVLFTGADGQPPSKPPSSLAATQDGKDVLLTWSAAKDDLGLLSYDVHRSETKGFAPRRSNRVGKVRNTQYRDRGANAGKNIRFIAMPPSDPTPKLKRVRGKVKSVAAIVMAAIERIVAHRINASLPAMGEVRSTIPNMAEKES